VDDLRESFGMKVQIAVFLALAVAMIAGCSDNGLPMVPVYGKVTFAGGPPPKPGSITFSPISIEPGLPNRPGTAQFDTNGEFQVTSFKKNDGLVAGTYQANIACWLKSPSASDPSSFDRFNAVPKGFEPPQVVVGADAGEVEVVIDVPKKP
jgi:hypothetical protein